MDYNPFRSGRATQETVQESKFLIPEEIPAQERTAFHGAAAAAHKAGKSHFSFNGKKHPVTMKKDTANAIADQKEGYMKDLDTEKSEPSPRSDAKVAADFKKRRKMNKPGKAEGGGKEGDVAMNPKMDSEKKEQKESKIRSALKSILERKENHSPNQDKAEKIGDNIKGQGAKDMMAAADNAVSQGPEAHLNEPEINKDNFKKMTSNVPAKKMRKNDNPKGDGKIVPGGTQFKDPAAMKAESYDKVSGLKAAYASMYQIEEPVETEELDESMLGHKGASAANGGKSLDPRFKSSASHIDYHHRRSDGHTKSGGDEDQHRYQVAKKLGYKV